MRVIKYTESIKLEINVGDILLGGRFKNKQIKVKKIGKDKNGQKTVNGKPLLNFRIWKDLPQTMKDKFQLKDNKKNEGFFFKEKLGEEQAEEIYNYLLEHPKELITKRDEILHDREGLQYTWILVSFIMRKEDRRGDNYDPFGEEILSENTMISILKHNVFFIFYYHIIIDNKELECSKSIAKKIFKLCEKMKNEQDR